MYQNSLLTLISVLLAGLMISSVDAGPGQKDDGCAQKGGCARCGCDAGCCNAVCRLVKEERELKVTCWTSECKPVCLPCCSHRGCRHCEPACGGKGKGCGDKGSCQKGGGLCGIGGKKFVWFDYEPGCAKARCKKHLMKKTVTKTVPGYKWVVEDLCKGCEAKAKADAPVVEPDAEVPAPPPVEARIIYGKPVHTMAAFPK